MFGWGTRSSEGIPPEQAPSSSQATRAYRPAATRSWRLRRAAHQTATSQLREQSEKKSPLSVRLETKRHEQGALSSRIERDLRLLGLAAGDITDLGPAIDSANERVERAFKHREEAEQQLEKISEGRKAAAEQYAEVRRQRRAENLIGGPTATAADPIINLDPDSPSNSGTAKVERVGVRLSAREHGQTGGDGDIAVEWSAREENHVGQPDGLSPAEGQAIARVLAARLGGHRERPLLNPVVERVLLIGSAFGEFGLNYVAVQVMALPSKASIAFTVAVSFASVMLAVTVGRILNRLAEGPDGLERYRFRRIADIAVVLLATASGVAIAIAIAFLREAYLEALYTVQATTDALARDVPPIDQDFVRWLRWLALGLLGLAVAVAYAGGPAQRELRHPWQALGRWLLDRIRRWLILRAARREAKEELDIANKSVEFEDKRLEEARRQLQAAEQEVSRAMQYRERLREELERRGGKLLGTEQAMLRGWWSQASVGDAACHQLDRFLAQALVRNRRGVRDRLLSWWRGRPWNNHEEFELMERTAHDASTWERQIDKVTRRAKELLSKHGVVNLNFLPSRPDDQEQA